MRILKTLAVLFIASTRASDFGGTDWDFSPNDLLDLESQEGRVLGTSETENVRTLVTETDPSIPVERRGYPAPMTFKCPPTATVQNHGLDPKGKYCGLHNQGNFFLCENGDQPLCYLGYVYWTPQNQKRICADTPKVETCVLLLNSQPLFRVDEKDDPIWQDPKPVEEPNFFQKLWCTFVGCG